MEETLSKTDRAAVSGRNKAGLILASLIAAGDIYGPFMPFPAEATAGPPMPVLIAGAVLGVITIGAAIYTWRTGSRVTARIAAGSRILAILGALPAFFAPGVPPSIVALVGLSTVLTVVAVVLMLSRARPGI